MHVGENRVVIIGGGFGGLAAARALADAQVEVTLLDRYNHHLFQPLLYQVATAGLSPSDIAEPLRKIFRRQANVRVLLGTAKRIDVERKTVITQDGELAYDYLIIAAGARHSYFGHDEWEAFAPGLKEIGDALEIRRRILLAFEIAEKTPDPKQRETAMTFVIVGAGPTGVEMAGAIAELARHTLVRDFRQIDPSNARIIIVDAMPRVLPTFAEDLSEKTLKRLHAFGIEVRSGVKVERISPEGVEIRTGTDKVELLPAKTVIWAAGNVASPLGESLGVTLDKQRRVLLNDDLTVPGHPEIQVIGDMGNFSHQTGKSLPAVSPVAIQQGRLAAANIKAMIDGRPRKRFVYIDRGTMATIGRNAAVADLRIVRFNGFPAWLTWLFVHLIFLIGFRNRLMVLIQWAYHYLTYGRGARLITGRDLQGTTD